MNTTLRSNIRTLDTFTLDTLIDTFTLDTFTLDTFTLDTFTLDTITLVHTYTGTPFMFNILILDTQQLYPCLIYLH